jgi:hypothetical protein
MPPTSAFTGEWAGDAAATAAAGATLPADGLSGAGRVADRTEPRTSGAGELSAAGAAVRPDTGFDAAAGPSGADRRDTRRDA